MMMDLDGCYRVEEFEAEAVVADYVESCVNVEEFLECCKACHNYEHVWSCPPFDFSPEEYWKRYDKLYLRARKILFSEEMLKRDYTSEELEEITRQVMGREKEKLGELLFSMERENPGSISLWAGRCRQCGQTGCSRETGEACKHPDKLRYSIEALGGNVGLTITKYLGQQLIWMEEGKLPEYFMLVGGLLVKDR